jgi:hypothetical protein
MKSLPRWLLLAGFCLTIFGGKLWLVNTAASDLPTWDQWDAESEVVLRPWLEGWMGAKEIFHPHNEHRVVVTKLFVLGLFIANGQWDALVEIVAGAAVHVLSALALLLLGQRWLRGAWLAAYGGLLILLFTLPFSWENSLFGFQSMFYFLELFSLGQIWLSVEGDRFGTRWAVGQLCGAFAVLTMASGFIASLAVLAVLGHRFVRERRCSAQQITTAGLALIFTLIGWCLKNYVPAHADLQAHSPAQFIDAVLRLLAWPGVAWFPWSLLLFLPALYFIVRAARRRETSGPDAVLLGLIAWVLLQVAATAYARGGSDAVLSPRYLDLLAVNVTLGWLLLVREFSGRPRLLIAVIWLAAVLAGLTQQSRQMWEDYVAPYLTRHQRQEGHVRDFLRTGHPDNLMNQPPGDVPYPVGSVLVQRLSSPAIQGIMPASVRRPVALGWSAPTAVPPTLSGGPWPVALSTWSPPAGSPSVDWRSTRQPATTLPVLRFRIAGDLGEPGNSLRLVVKSSAGDVPVVPDEAPGERWKLVSVFRPAGEWWIEAHGGNSGSWFAFTGPVEVGRWSWFTGKLLKLHVAVILAGFALLAAGAWLGFRPARS